MAEDKTPPNPDEIKPADKPAAKASLGEKKAKPKSETPAAKKKEKPPAIEKKPFAEFIKAHYLPGLTAAFEKQGVSDLKLTFEANEVTGVWQNGDRQFTVYFLDGDISKKKAFTCSTKNAPAAIIESFLIDERKITLDLLVFGVIQRINAQTSNALISIFNQRVDFWNYILIGFN